MKTKCDGSLRCQVEKWLAPAPAAPVHVTDFGRTRWYGTRYACVETSSRGDTRVLFFFRHHDGTWWVFPPAVNSRKLTPGRIGV